MALTPRKIAILLLCLLAAFAAGSLALWKSGLVQRWLRAEAVKTYVNKIQPHLPFTIESADLDSGTHLQLVLKWGAWRIRLNGELDASEKDNLYVGSYSTSATIEPVDAPSQISTPVHLELEAGVAKSLNSLGRLGVLASADQFEWKLFQVKARELHVEAEWSKGSAGVELSLGGLELSQPTRSLNLASLSFDGETELSLKPIALGNQGTFKLETSGGEALLGELYLDLPLKGIPLAGDFSLSENKPRSAHIRIGEGARTPLTLDLTLDDQVHPTRLRWRSEPLEVAKLVPPLLATAISTGGSAANLSRFSAIQYKAGTLSTSGEVNLDPVTHALKSWFGSLKLNQLGFDWPEMKLKLRGLGLDIPSANASLTRGKIQVAKIGFRQLKASLKPLQFSLSKRPGGGATASKGYDFHLGAGDSIPLVIEKIPLSIGALAGRIGGGTNEDDSYELETKLNLKPVELVEVLHAACMKHDHAPPAQLSGEFPAIKLTPGDVDPTGKFRVNFFNGLIEVSDIGAFDILSPVPEFDFSVNWGGIQLDQLGEFLGFGEMDGTLQGYAKGVVFQAWLPTQFDFKLEVKPLHHNKVVFSPDAMKNVVRLFAADGIDQIPGIANWLAFGWPSRVFGGYDVQYAGISLFSNDGMILVETLDPVSVFGSASQGRKHYILYGPRFKMPLESSHYPLVMDAPSMGNFVRQLSIQLGKMAEAKKAKKPGEKQDDPDHDEECMPGDLN